MTLPTPLSYGPVRMHVAASMILIKAMVFLLFIYSEKKKNLLNSISFFRAVFFPIFVNSLGC